MTSEHTGRNAPCPCGSGKKYKKCCLAKTEGPQPPAEAADLDSQIHDAAMLSLEHNEDAVVEAVSRLEALLGDQRLDEAQKRNVRFQLAQVHQRRGQHRTALELLESSEAGSPTPDEPLVEAHVTTLRAISLSALGAHQKACGLFDQVLTTLADSSADARTVAIVNLEAGKAYKLGGNTLLARKCWETTLAYCEGRDDEVEHWGRVKENLGFLLLDDPDARKQEEGICIVEQSSVLKRQIGDVDGLANNYCQLGLYFAGIGRFERAIAHMRMDLSLSRHVGNLRSTAATLGNLAGLYVKMCQLSKARNALKEAKQIGEDLGDGTMVKCR